MDGDILSPTLPKKVSDVPDYIPEKIECPECSDEAILDGLSSSLIYKTRVYAEYSCIMDDCPTNVRLTFEGGKITKAECFRIYQGHQDCYDFTKYADRVLPRVSL